MDAHTRGCAVVALRAWTPNADAAVRNASHGDGELVVADGEAVGRAVAGGSDTAIR